MKLFIFAALTVLSLNSMADELFCSIVGDSSSSKLRITYENLSPVTVALKSPESDEYRHLMMKVKPVVPINQNGYESFSALPFLDFEIDWSKEENCYKEIGSQWYFEFNHSVSRYTVQILPYFETSHSKCVLPRFQPQQKTLNCSY